jgi:DNA-binding CsgD family transcriptional regulator
VGVSRILSGRNAGTRITRLSDRLVLVSVPVSHALEGTAAAVLTKAEKAVAELAASGLSNAAIARRRRCAPRTIANQLAAIYKKLGIESRRKLRARFGT